MLLTSLRKCFQTAGAVNKVRPEIIDRGQRSKKHSRTFPDLKRAVI